MVAKYFKTGIKSEGVERGFVALLYQDYYDRYSNYFLQKGIDANRLTNEDILIHAAIESADEDIKPFLEVFLESGIYSDRLDDYFKRLSTFELYDDRLDISRPDLARLFGEVSKVRKLSPQAIKKRSIFKVGDQWMVKGDNTLGRVFPVKEKWKFTHEAVNEEYMGEAFSKKIFSLVGRVPDTKLLRTRFVDTEKEKVMVATRMVDGFQSMERRLFVNSKKLQLLEKEVNSANLFRGYMFDGDQAVFVNGLAEALIGSMFVDDRDFVGKFGQNIGVDEENTLTSVDIGHGFEGKNRKNIGSSFVPSIKSAVTSHIPYFGKSMEHRNFSIFDEVPLYDQLLVYNDFLQQFEQYPGQTFEEKFRSFINATKFFIEFEGEEDFVNRKLTLFFKRMEYIDSIFNNRVRALNTDNGRKLITLCDDIQLLVLNTKNNPSLTRGLYVTDRTNYIDIIETGDNYVFSLKHKNSKYIKRMMELVRGSQFQYNEKDLSIVVPKVKLDDFIVLVGQKREKQNNFVQRENARVELTKEVERTSREIEERKKAIDEVRTLKEFFQMNRDDVITIDDIHTAVMDNRLEYAKFFKKLQERVTISDIMESLTIDKLARSSQVIDFCNSIIDNIVREKSKRVFQLMELHDMEKSLVKFVKTATKERVAFDLKSKNSQAKINEEDIAICSRPEHIPESYRTKCNSGIGLNCILNSEIEGETKTLIIEFPDNPTREFAGNKFDKFSGCTMRIPNFPIDSDFIDFLDVLRNHALFAALSSQSISRKDVKVLDQKGTLLDGVMTFELMEAMNRLERSARTPGL